MKILGISAFYHDSAAVFLNEGKIEGAAQEERFTRKKYDAAFPTQAIRWLMEENGFTLNDLDAVVFYDKPWLKFERLLETYYHLAPSGFTSFRQAMPVWIKEKVFLKKIIQESLSAIDQAYRKERKGLLLFAEHHLSHAASTFYPSGYEEAAILTIDGVGEWATASLSYGKDTQIRILKELHFPHSLGLLYSAFTYFLGFKVNSGEYKLMGLAPYGSSVSREYAVFKEKILQELVRVYDDGSLWLNQRYFNYMGGLTMINEGQWEKLFGMKRRNPEEELKEIHCHLALVIQHITEDIIIRMAAEVKRITGSGNLCMAGGVALNCVANGKLQDRGLFKNIFITPASGDAGGALGAALASHHMYFGKPRQYSSSDMLRGALLGPDFSEKDTERVIKKYQAVAHKFQQQEMLMYVARSIAEGKVVGWFQSAMEFGPRALGSRSILGDPRNPEMQKSLNLKIKYRESFRPFAASVLEDEAAEYFELNTSSPYMLLVKKIKDRWITSLPENYHELSMWDKLYVPRSLLPAITHVDFSCRIQTVSASTHPLYYTLLQEFKKITGIGVLVNTSFNVRGEPIVCTPEDAYRCFMRTNMDVLVIGNYVFLKNEQPSWREGEAWKEILKAD